MFEERTLLDASRRRGHFHENMLAFGSISILIDDLVHELGREFRFSIDDTDDAHQMCTAREWIRNRTHRTPLHDVVLTATSVWHGYLALLNHRR
ncbi:hypothetical protein A6A22_10090 [Arthrobacter sp. OY3WO11]|nr:hypothetical protein A6A22_10090 [Arthrobacter sp. OY3WO11]